MRKQKDRRELEFQLATEILKLTTALITLLTALLHFLIGD